MSNRIYKCHTTQYSTDARRTSLFLMGNARRNNESASLLTRDPVPEAFSTAEAMKLEDIVVVVVDVVVVVVVKWDMGRFCATIDGVPHNETVRAAIPAALPTHETRDDDEEEWQLLSRFSLLVP